MFFFITSSHTFFIAPKLSQNNFKNQIVWEVLVGEVLVGTVLVGTVLVVGEVVGELVAEVVGVVLVGAVLVVGEVVGGFVGEVVGAVQVGAVLVSLEGRIKGEEVREGTCS